MNERNNKHPVAPRTKPGDRKGIALILTMAILVILTTIIYSLASRVLVHKRRQEYIINYQIARYACDSAMKYALTRINSINMKLITREDFPDFSDLFVLDHEQYTEILDAWAEEQRQKRIEDGDWEDIEEKQKQDQKRNMSADMMAGVSGDPNTGASDFIDNLLSSIDGDGELTDVNDLFIPGPYGYQWPQVYEPIELEIGDAKVKITFNDENAKFPLTLMLTQDQKLTRALDDALSIFCEWMQMDIEEIEMLAIQLQSVAEKKEYNLKMKPIITLEKIQTTAQTSSKGLIRTRGRTRGAIRRRPATRTTVKKTTRSADGHIADFAKILHSSKVNTFSLAKPLPGLMNRYESPLKYLGIWGTDKVNVNTAPRHVLEAIFALGGDQALIAEEIIQQRKFQPFKKIEDLREMLYAYNDSFEKVKPYLITKSTYITVEVRAVCGNSKAASVTIVRKVGKNYQQIGMLSI